MAEKKLRISPLLYERSLELRQNSTAPEQLLWSALRAKQLGGFKFRRQTPIDSFVVDFYCPEAQLVIEVDGESHEGHQAYDAARQHRLEEIGLRVFRCTNDDVLTNLDGVAEAILSACISSGADPSPSPSPREGRGVTPR